MSTRFILVSVLVTIINSCLLHHVSCRPQTTAEGYNQAAASLIEAMDFNVAPCQDFYQYACGGWMKKNHIPPSKARWSQIDILRDKLVNSLKLILEQDIDPRDPKPLNSAREMYKACMNTNAIQALGLKPLIEMLESFGGWPMTKRMQESNFDWKVVTASLRKIYSTPYLLNVYNDLDSHNTERSSIYIDQGTLSLPRYILLNQNGYPKVMAAYTAFISGAAKIIRDTIGGGANNGQIETDTQDLIRFEFELARIMSSGDVRRNTTRTYNPMLVTEIQSWTDGFSSKTQHAHVNWSEYLNMIYSVANVDISTHERIIVVEKQYIQNLFILLDATPPRIVGNYILWRLVRFLSPGMNSQLTNLAINLSKALYGNPQTEPRSNNCANEINGLLGFAISGKYIENNFDESAKAQIESMITFLKASFVTLIDEAIWMDSATKAIAKDKVDAMTNLVAYPDWIKSKAELEAHYDGLVVSNNHFNNIQNVNAFLARQDFGELRSKVNRNSWITFPTIVNAFYSPVLNSISFPAGILQPPYFGWNGRTIAMNYGGIGSIIGHEITHGFDDRGRQYDKYGNIAPWWTPDTLNQYLSKTRCFTEKFNNYVVLNGTRLNGVTTLGENIADYGGIREAFRAYKHYVALYGVESPLPGLESFTPEQIFFITYANTYCGVETPEKLLNQIMTGPHSPNRFRVIGTLSNSEDFVREFNCPPDSQMNQLNKCPLWR